MDFQKKDWQFRDIISEDELNRMEDGIEEGITKAEQAEQVAEQAQQTAEFHASRHASDGPDPITPGMIGAETPAGAQAKADAAEANAKSYTDTITGLLANLTTEQKANLVAAINELVTNLSTSQRWKLTIDTGHTRNISGQDLNNLTNTGFYSGNNLTNSPDGSTNYFYVEVVNHSSGTNYVKQTAVGISGGGYSDTAYKVYVRQKSTVGWGTWREVITSAVLRWNVDHLEYNDGGVWRHLGNIQVGKLRSVTSGGTVGTWVDVVNITGVKGRAERIFALIPTNYQTIGIRVTIDGITEEITGTSATSGLSLSYLGRQMQTSGITNATEPIYFNSQFRVQFYKQNASTNDTCYVDYALELGTP
jgi:hypothetical protein